MPENENPSKSMAEPWYRDGLRFRCTQCGNCCTGAPGAVWVSEEELAAIAEHLGKSVGEVRLLHTRKLLGRTSLREFANGDCEFLDGQTRQCKIYPVRPVQCRTWPFWPSNLSSKEMWCQTEQVCPGAGHGDFFSLEEIEARASQTEI
jgi:uncharacterized protein